MASSSSSAPSLSNCKLVFVGTGVSTGIPVIGHPIEGAPPCACTKAMSDKKNPNYRNNVSILIERFPSASTTPSAESGAEIEQGSSSLEGQRQQQQQPTSRLLVDVGKTFRDAFFNVLAPRKMTSVDCVLYTHDHADAIYGTDDVRDLQIITPNLDDPKHTQTCNNPVAAFMAHTTFVTMSRTHDYIFRNSRIVNSDGQGPEDESALAFAERRKGTLLKKQPEEYDPWQVSEEEATRHVVQLLSSEHPAATEKAQSGDDEVAPTWKPLVIPRRTTCLNIFLSDDSMPRRIYPKGFDGIPFFSLPVEHGKHYTCLGFAFGSGLKLKTTPTTEESEGDAVVYLSDVSAVYPSTKAFLKQLKKIDLFVIDALHPEGKPHFSHFCLAQAWDLVKELKPKHVRMIGMFCNLEHDETNERLAKYLAEFNAALGDDGQEGKIASCCLAHDGLELDVKL